MANDTFIDRRLPATPASRPGRKPVPELTSSLSKLAVSETLATSLGEAKIDGASLDTPSPPTETPKKEVTPGDIDDLIQEMLHICDTDSTPLKSGTERDGDGTSP